MVIFIGPIPPPLGLRGLLKDRLPPLLRPLLSQSPLVPHLRRACLMVLQTPIHPSKLQLVSRSGGEIRVGITMEFFLLLHDCYEGLTL